MSEINMFRGRWAFLSNFSYVAHGVYGYPTNEHFFMAMKSKDPEYRALVKVAPTPGNAKKMGSQVQLREDWEEIKDEVMLAGLRVKFWPTTLLAALLLGTDDLVLKEGNWWHDQYWGDCSCPTHKNTPGENKLGILLMQVREELRNESR